MAHLAIQGHATRGNEVIALLEMLGGINSHNLYGDESYTYYNIDSDKEIKGGIYVFGDEKLLSFTLEEFEEKFPYKVGDKVNSPCRGCVKTITSMGWDDYLNTITYKLDDREYTHIALLKVVNDLPLVEQKPMGEKKINQMSLANCDLDEVEIVLGDKFELKIKDGKYYAVRKQYPKTYEECCDVLIPDCVEFNVILNGYNSVLLEEFGKLLICRDAYWKLADNWKPDWNNISDKHCIYVVGKEMWSKECQTRQCTLAFPTAEMRDAFCENFKDLIEQCKELL